MSPSSENGKDAYHWTLFTNNKDQLCTKNISDILDQEIRKVNGDYSHARNVGVLGPVAVTLVDSQKLQTLFSENRHRGQFKLKTIFACAQEYRTFMTEKMSH